MTTLKNPKNPLILCCENCDYNTCNKKDFNKHLKTKKHNNVVGTTGIVKKIPKIPKIPKKNNYTCICGKTYIHNSSLWNHKKKCNNIKIDINEKKNTAIDLVIKEQNDLKNIVIEVMKSNNELQKQNFELQKQVLDVCKNIHPHISNSNNNSNNKTFNLQFFLNEQCKDAMNITDFINSVTLSLNDLENMGSLGYVNGISSIIIKELRGLDITKRPVHCSDAKRETLYIKDEDKWEKECPENTKMKTAIRTVEKKNIKLISEWTDKHPKFTNSTTKENDEYLQILIETMGGKGDYEKNKNKVIKNIAKEVIIDK